MPGQIKGNIKIFGSINGIGNVTGHGSQSHVQINFIYAPKSSLSSQGSFTQVEFNPGNSAEETVAFAAHADDPIDHELHHLIGQRAELERLAFLNGRAKEQSRGAILFLTGPAEYGARALGRAFVDMVRKGSGNVAITRFWKEGLAHRIRRDPRWSMALKKNHQTIEEDWPSYAKQEALLPLQALLVQLIDNAQIGNRAKAGQTPPPRAPRPASAHPGAGAGPASPDLLA